MVFQGSKFAGFGESSQSGHVRIDGFCLFLRTVIEFVSLVNYINIGFANAMRLPQFQDSVYVGFLLFTSKRWTIMDFEGVFTNAGDKRCNAKEGLFYFEGRSPLRKHPILVAIASTLSTTFHCVFPVSAVKIHCT